MDIECPYCGSGESHIINTRPTYGGRRRRYKCDSCDGRFSSFEMVVEEGNNRETKESIQRRMIISSLTISDLLNGIADRFAQITGEHDGKPASTD